MGNLRSVLNKARCFGTAAISNSREAILSASRIVLPGVGHFGSGMENLRNLGLIDTITSQARQGVPILGICLGMQLMMSFGEEGGCAGLGLIDGVARRISGDHGLRVP